MNTARGHNKYNHISYSSTDMIKFKSMRKMCNTLSHFCPGWRNKQDVEPQIEYCRNALYEWWKREFNAILPGNYIAYILDNESPVYVGKVLQKSDSDMSVCTDTDGWRPANEYVKIARPCSAYDIWKAVNRTLECYPFSGKCIAVHQNEWLEWIADCKIGTGYSHWKKQYSYCQKMVNIYDFSDDLDYPGVTLWDAADNKRLPSFGEESGIHDGEPESPYIMEMIKQYNKQYPKDRIVF